MVSYTPKLKDVLRTHGCRYDRAGRGDHEIWYSPISQRYFPVDHKILSRHTANGVLKQAGIPKQF
ncbi:MAG: type II toxin-antitoxin system HicA family toxin [Terriglobia bacterium]